MKNGSHVFNCTLFASSNRTIFEAESIREQAFFKGLLSKCAQFSGRYPKEYSPIYVTCMERVSFLSLLFFRHPLRP